MEAIKVPKDVYWSMNKLLENTEPEEVVINLTDLYGDAYESYDAIFEPLVSYMDEHHDYVKKLIRGCFDGFTIDQPPEDRLKDRFDIWNAAYRDSMAVDQKHALATMSTKTMVNKYKIDGLITTLNILDISIQGINTFEGDK